MADALLQLMREKQFSKITIKEISDIAGVNRSSCFRNFDTKNEALTFKLVLLDEWIKRGFYETSEEIARLVNKII
ncbi:MAG: TetR family transcriptional regulator [Lachnospiraceae bacterium]|nr:TetR family transcriptional regulator [Lachnospiraceae bacterium]